MISHLVDPDGDIDLLLLEDAALRLDCEFELHPLASKLDYGRPTTPILTNSKKKKKKGSKDESVYTQEPEPVNVIKLLSLGENNDKNRSQELESIGHGGECVASEADDALVRIRVSSKHLILASSYFKRSLQSGLAESCALQAHGHVEVNMKEHDPEAMLIVMNSIHGRNRRIPSSVDVNMLTKIAVLVDYIQSHETIEPFSDRWIEKMEEKIPKIYCRELVHWLCISYVFDKASIFKTVTHTALCQATGPVAEIGVPIWDYVSDKLNQQRSATIEHLLSGLETLLDSLRLDQNECTFDCNAMQYGKLAKELGYRRLLFPRPQTPFFGYSFNNIVSSIRHIQNSPSCDRCAVSPCDSSAGNLMPRIEVVIKHTADTMEQKGSKELFVQVMEIRRECFGQATRYIE